MKPLTKEEIVKSIKELRVTVDSFIGSVIVLKSSREVSLVRTKLQESKSWLGICLKEIGEPNPYPTSMDPASPTIEPQADRAYAAKTIFADENVPNEQIAMVKFFRRLIDAYLFEYRKLNEAGEQTNPYGQYFNDAFHKSYEYLLEAKMWLGWELDRIRTEQSIPAAAKS